MKVDKICTARNMHMNTSIYQKTRIVCKTAKIERKKHL